MEFKGGIYCSQVKSRSVYLALKLWSTKLTEQRKDIKFLTLEKIERVRKQIVDGEKPTKLKGLKNIWFVSFFLNRDKMFINIIKTV
jgi:hypothetical protein